MNAVIASAGTQAATAAGAAEPIRTVTPIVINPSEDLAVVARDHAHRMPRLVRWLMDGLGTPDVESADLMSYLLFDREYTRALVDIGYRDAHRRIDELEEFLHQATMASALSRGTAA